MAMTSTSAPDPRVSENLELLVKGSDKTAKISFIISVLAICIAAGSVYFAFKDSKDDAIWQKEQLRLLQDISNKLSTVNNPEDTTTK